MPGSKDEVAGGCEKREEVECNRVKGSYER